MGLYSFFEQIDHSKKNQIFMVLLSATLVIIFCMQKINSPLITPDAPQGIISYEFAKSVENANKIITSWNNNTQICAGIGLGLDYLFLLFYSITISFACLMVAEKRSSITLKKNGILLAWLIFIAALLDCIENYALIRILLNSIDEIWPPTAFYCASLKFIIVGICLLYIIAGILMTLFNKAKSS